MTQPKTLDDLLKTKPREYWGNWMALESTESMAKDITPKPEWVDIKCFVDKTYADKLRAALEVALLFIDCVESPIDALVLLHKGMAAETKAKITEILKGEK